MNTQKNIRISEEIDKKLNQLKFKLMLEKKLYITKKQLIEMLISKQLDKMLEKTST